MTTVKLTEELTSHLRTLLFEDMHERAGYLAKAAHSAHEGPSATDAARHVVSPFGDSHPVFFYRRRRDILLGKHRDAGIGRLQRLVDALVASGLSPSTVQCSLLPLRAMYKRALSLDELSVNPTVGSVVSNW